MQLPTAAGQELWDPSCTTLVQRQTEIRNLIRNSYLSDFRYGPGRWSTLRDRMSYVSVSRLRVAAESSDALVAAFRDRAHLVDAADGFEGIQVWRSEVDPTEVLMVSHWRDREAFKTYMRSNEHRLSHARIPDELEAAIKLEQLEHLRTYDVVAE